MAERLLSGSPGCSPSRATGDGGSGSNDRAPAKRRRTAVACSVCRARKSRCNGARPCSICEALGFECVYESSAASVHTLVRKDYLNELEARIKAIEANVARHEQLFSADQRPPMDRGVSHHAAQALADDDDDRVPMQDNPSPREISLRGADLQDLPPEENFTDGMAASFMEEEDSGFFGPSSNISFMRRISRAISNDGQPGALRTPGSSDDFLDTRIINVSRPQSPHNRSSEHPQRGIGGNSPYSLPSEAVSYELMERYFSNTGLLFPYIHKETFLESYREMKARQFTKVRRTWLGVFNMILAMASSTTVHAKDAKKAKDRIRESDVFYQRALALCQTQMLRGTSLETVQYLLLMTQYLQGTQKSVQTWTIHGLAVKSALSIGLHSTDASRNFSPIEKEMRKRTWFGCVILDRSLSMTFGRPLAIPESYVKISLPAMIDAIPRPYGEQDNSATRDYASVMFFNATILLYHIASEVIVSLYGANLGCGSPTSGKEIVSWIVKFEQDLDDWSNSLPSRLKLCTGASVLSDPGPDPVMQRFKVVLSLRYLNLQVLLHRPALVKYMDQRRAVETESPVQNSTDQLQAAHMRTCVSCAEEIITIVHTVVAEGVEAKKYLGAWWFSLYYVFNAALVVLGAYLAAKKHGSSALASAADAGKCAHTLEIANQALLELDEGNATVQRCADYLNQLMRHMKLSTHTNPSAPEFERHDENNGVYAQMQPGGRDNSQPVIPGFADAWNPTLFGSFDGGDLELGQFFVPGDNDMWMHNGAARNS